MIVTALLKSQEPGIAIDSTPSSVIFWISISTRSLYSLLLDCLLVPCNSTFSIPIMLIAIFSISQTTSGKSGWDSNKLKPFGSLNAVKRQEAEPGIFSILKTVSSLDSNINLLICEAK